MDYAEARARIENIIDDLNNNPKATEAIKIYKNIEALVQNIGATDFIEERANFFKQNIERYDGWINSIGEIYNKLIENDNYKFLFEQWGDVLSQDIKNDVIVKDIYKLKSFIEWLIESNSESKKNINGLHFGTPMKERNSEAREVYALLEQLVKLLYSNADYNPDKLMIDIVNENKCFCEYRDKISGPYTNEQLIHMLTIIKKEFLQSNEFDKKQNLTQKIKEEKRMLVIKFAKKENFSPRLTEVLEYRIVDALSNVEIAKKMDIDKGAVENYINKMNSQLRDKYPECCSLKLEQMFQLLTEKLE